VDQVSLVSDVDPLCEVVRVGLAVPAYPANLHPVLPQRLQVCDQGRTLSKRVGERSAEMLSNALYNSLPVGERGEEPCGSPARWNVMGKRLRKPRRTGARNNAGKARRG